MDEFLKNAWEESKGFLIDQFLKVILMVLNNSISTDRIYNSGFRLGKEVTTAGTKKLGGTWNQGENIIQKLADPFYDGFNDGLNADDI
jgi:hypothetical protein